MHMVAPPATARNSRCIRPIVAPSTQRTKHVLLEGSLDSIQSKPSDSFGPACQKPSTPSRGANTVCQKKGSVILSGEETQKRTFTIQAGRVQARIPKKAKQLSQLPCL